MFEIGTLTSSIEKQTNGMITGVIYCRINGIEFPDSKWNDNLVIILSWWLSAIESLIADSYPSIEEFVFTEGPYRVRFRKISSQLCEVSGFAQSKEIIKAVNVSILELEQQVRNVIKKILHLCNENGWNNDDIATLRSHYEAS